MTENQAKLIQITKQFEAAKDQYKELSAQLNEACTAVAQETGLDVLFQDPTDGTVFKIERPKGTYVEFRQIGYARTRREGEKKGSISIKDAKDAGFNVK